MASSNVLGIVKELGIRQSAAKFPSRKNVQRLSRKGVEKKSSRNSKCPTNFEIRRPYGRNLERYRKL